MMKFLRHLPFVLLFVASVMPSLTAAVIVDTGPGTATGFGAALGNVGPLHNQALAGQFTLSSVNEITSISGWINASFQGGGLDIAINSDLNSFPGSALFQGSIHLDGSSVPGWERLSGLDWRLGSGTYWVVFSSPDLMGYMPGLSQEINSAVPISSLSNYASTDTKQMPLSWHLFLKSNDGLPLVDHAFGVQISGNDITTLTPVPEPSTYGMFASLSLMGLAIRKRYVACQKSRLE